MSKETVQLWKFAVAVFSLLIAGSWIWSWANPQDYSNYPVNPPGVTNTPNWKDQVVPNSNLSTIDPCEDAPTVEDYKSCLEDMALEDWMDDQRGNAGLP